MKALPRKEPSSRRSSPPSLSRRNGQRDAPVVQTSEQALPSPPPALAQIPDWWKTREHLASFLNTVKPELTKDSVSKTNGTELGAFYSLSNRLLTDHGGSKVVRSYGHPLRALATAFPDHKWEPWRFTSVPRNWWNEQKNVQEFLLHLGGQLKGISPAAAAEALEGLYSATQFHFIDNGGAGLLKNSRIAEEIMRAFPHHPWEPFKFLSLSSDWWNSLENRKKHLNWLAGQYASEHNLDTRKEEFWYSLRKEHLLPYPHARKLLRIYGSVAAAIEALVPPFGPAPWRPWQFASLPSSWFADKAHQKQYMQWLGETLQFNSPTDWYRISVASLADHFGAPLLALYGDSPVGVVRGVYSEGAWDLGKFARPPRNSFAPGDQEDNIAKAQALSNTMMETLNLKTMEDWYKVSYRQFKSNKGEFLISLCGVSESTDNSMYSVLKRVYPSYKWKEWRFHVPPGWWTEAANLRSFFDDVIAEKNLEKPEDLYNITFRELRELHGGALLASSPTLAQAVAKAYPEIHWLPWRFQTISQGFWKNKDNQRQFCKWVAAELKFKSLDDWYSVTNQTIKEISGKRMQHYHGYALLPMLQRVYPDHKWEPWKFVHTPANFWAENSKANDTRALTDFLESILTALGFSAANKADWYRVTADLIPGRYMTMLRNTYGGLAPALQKCYPKHPWDLRQFLSGRKKGAQAVVRVKVDQIIPPETKETSDESLEAVVDSSRPRLGPEPFEQ